MHKAQLIKGHNSFKSKSFFSPQWNSEEILIYENNAHSDFFPMLCTRNRPFRKEHCKNGYTNKDNVCCFFFTVLYSGKINLVEL